MKERSSAYKIALSALMAALANLLGIFAVPGPWNIKFGMTGIPILITSFALGPFWGALCGLLGGITQALNYGSIWYVIYTAIQGCVAGLFVRHYKSIKWWSLIMGFLGGFFLILWVDLLRQGPQTFQELTSPNAPKIFGLNIIFGFPIFAIISGIVVAIIAFLLSSKVKEMNFFHLTLAGCFGAIAYVPYDAIILYYIQLYPWIPTWFVLSKDLVQDFFAAILCAWIYQNARISKALSR
jgi:uncharacterized membrane protein